MESDRTPQNSNSAIYIVMAAVLMAVGGGSALLYRDYGAFLFEPPKPARVDSKIIKDAWINVAPPEQFVAPKAMMDCLSTAKAGETIKEDTLREQARACEIKVLRAMPKERESALEAAKRRLIVTRIFWPDEPMITAGDYAVLQSPVAQPKPVHRWDKFGTPELVSAVWRAGATTPEEKMVSTFLVDCLRLEALEGVNVPLLHKRATHCEALSAVSATLNVQARNTVVAYRDKVTNTYWLGGKPQIMIVNPSPDTVPAVVVREPLTRASVEESWKNTTDANELLAASNLIRCLHTMPNGSLGTSVYICELRAMNTGNYKAVDAVLMRRAKDIPEITGPGARYAGETAVAVSPPLTTPTQALETQDAPRSSTADKKMAHDLPGATALFDEWKKAALDAGSPQVADMLIDCMKKTSPISYDGRGLKVAVDMCKLSVQVEIEKQTQAGKALLDLGGGSL